MTAVGKYRKLRHRAVKLSDCGGYDLAAGEMNPMIVLRFAELLAAEMADSVFEPFANPAGRNFSTFLEVGIELTAHSLKSNHVLVEEVDSTAEEPHREFDGVLFHPPYFGSSPFTDDSRDLSNITDEDDWRAAMEAAADIVVEHLSPVGVVCAVGRRYRHGGKEIKLDEWIVTAFSGSLEPVEVWMSEPDVAIILRFEE